MTWAAVSFDLDDTLVDRDAAVRALLAARFPASVVPRDTPQLLRWIDEHAPALGRRGFRRALPGFVRPDPIVTRAVQRIAARHRIAVVSNGGPGQRRKLAAAGLAHAFEHVLVSSELRARKPDAAIFEQAAARLGVHASAILHVGNDPIDDILGATRAGFATCWVARGRTFPADLPRPTIVVDTIAELPEVLSC